MSITCASCDRWTSYASQVGFICGRTVCCSKSRARLSARLGIKIWVTSIVEGDKVCTMWCPLDSVTADSGSVRFVVGSHLWPDLYQPNLFVSSMVIPGTEGSADARC